METLDKFEQLAGDAQHATAILGNPALTDFELVGLECNPLSDERRQKLQDAGYFFVGCVGLVNGLPRVALSIPLAEPATASIREAFQTLVENLINEQFAASAADVSWLESLHKLPDTRQ